MTLNVAAGSDAPVGCSERLVRVAAAVRDGGIDVVVLQATGTEAQRAAITEALADHRPIAATAGGIAVFSRIPATLVGETMLTRAPHPDDGNDRSVLAVAIGAITLIAANFSWVAALAETNVTETLVLADTLGDCLIVGDLNQEPASAAMGALERAGFTDAWARLRHGAEGFTFELPRPTSRIDYVWERASPSRVRAIERIGGPGSPLLSNHAGLVADIAA